MNKIKNSFLLLLGCIGLLIGCDLQPKISSIPDSIGVFIENRFPALLADPETQPEIYNSAVTDYGVYSSPELYGSSNVDDYVMYSNVDDYVLKPEQNMTPVPVVDNKQIDDQKHVDDYIVVPVYSRFSESEAKSELKKENVSNEVIVVAKGDTLYSLSKKYNLTVEELAKINDLKSPYTLYVGQKLQTKSVKVKQDTTIDKVETKEVSEIKTVSDKEIRVVLTEIGVEKGDTLYSISRKYEVPVNDLAVINKLSAPFTLSVGQKIRVPKLNKHSETSIKQTSTKQLDIKQTKVDDKSTVKTVKQQNHVAEKQNGTTKTKISSDPSKQLPKISARSGTKFSWPVYGKILSAYGAKNNGLFNDGINISAKQGTNVKAAENGVVAYAGNEVKGMGNLVIMQHSDGWMTVYAHLDSMSVRRGNAVGVGQSIGKIGMTGKVDEPQLHFEIRKGTKAYDPVAYMKK